MVFWPVNTVVQYGDERAPFTFGSRRKTIMPGHPAPVPKFPGSQFPGNWKGPSDYESATANTRDLLCVAASNHGLGLTRLIFGMADDKAAPVRVLVVGPVGEFKVEIRLMEQLGLQDSVEFIGERIGEELWDLLCTCDAGIGMLNPAKVGLRVGSPLKHRTYASAGLPFMTALTDIGFPSKCDWKLQILDDGSKIEPRRIIAWLESMPENARAAERDYARTKLAPEAIASEILGALANARAG